MYFRLLMIVLGCFPLLVSRCLMLPMSNDYPPFIGNLTACAEQGYDTSNVNRE